jgi:hypothetical protein
VHGQPHGIFGEAQFQGVLVGDDVAWNREVLRQLAFGLERAERFQPPAAGDDAEYAVARVGDNGTTSVVARSGAAFLEAAVSVRFSGSGPVSDIGRLLPLRSFILAIRYLMRIW